jgi:TolA-binding protein
MSATQWIPDDRELDALARSLPPSEPSSDRTEQNRTRVLASAATVAQKSRNARRPMVAVAAVALAAAAALVIYLARRDASTTAPDDITKETIAELRPSRFDRGTWPSYRLRLYDGRLAVRIASLEATDRFVVTTVDAEVEARGARFVVDAAHERLEEILVEEGAVELRLAHQPPVFLSAGQSWRATKMARVEDLTPAKIEAQPRTGVQAPAPVTRTVSPRRIVTSATEAPRDVDRTAPAGAPPLEPAPLEPAPAPETPAKPGEAEFRRGWTALRGGDPATAASAFTRACNELTSDALGEDACYWAGVAAKRAGRSADARSSLARFIQRFPSSGRAGEAAALLGWLFYEADDLDGAERHFRRAATDRAPTVRTSAERGLEAIARKRKSR